MKICLIGDFSRGMDEGYKNICHSLFQWLEDGENTVRCLNIKQIQAPGFWKALAGNDAQIFHLITQPTRSSLCFCGVMRRYRPEARMVVSALKPESLWANGELTAGLQRLVRWARPDLIITQSRGAGDLFEGLGVRTAYIPNGVNTERFRAVDGDTKIRLRIKYGVETRSKVALHVGHLIRERNLGALRDLAKEGRQVVVVGSTYLGVDGGLLEALRSEGIRVEMGQQANIEEYYQLADAYVFPVLEGNSLSMPVSVLEAMACNLTVFTSKLAGLEGYFPEGKGLYYVERMDDLAARMRKAEAAGEATETSKLASRCTWERVAGEVKAAYGRLLEGQG